MEDKIEKFLSECSELNFGVVELSGEQEEFFRKFHREIASLCDSLPESTRVDALLFLVEYLGMQFDGEFNFFKNYHASAWSIIFWLTRYGDDDGALSQEDIRNAIKAHSMALLLHPLDDHLNDGQLDATHLNILIRSQAWMNMNTALNRFADGVDRGREIIDGFLDDYYSSIDDSGDIETLDYYCDLFRKQMATWLTTPVLIAKKIAADEDFARDIRNAYGSFGVAWRLLDDIKDLETDMMEGEHSSIYLCLPGKIRRMWNRDAAEKRGGLSDAILDHILRHDVVDRIEERMRKELDTAARIAEGRNMIGLSEEFRRLSPSPRNR